MLSTINSEEEKTYNLCLLRGIEYLWCSTRSRWTP